MRSRAIPEALARPAAACPPESDMIGRGSPEGPRVGVVGLGKGRPAVVPALAMQGAGARGPSAPLRRGAWVPSAGCRRTRPWDWCRTGPPRAVRGGGGQPAATAWPGLPGEKAKAAHGSVRRPLRGCRGARPLGNPGAVRAGSSSGRRMPCSWTRGRLLAPALCGVEVGDWRMSSGRGRPGLRRRPPGSALTLGNAGARGCWGCARAVRGVRDGAGRLLAGAPPAPARGPGRHGLCGVEVGERRMPSGRGCPRLRRSPPTARGMPGGKAAGGAASGAICGARECRWAASQERPSGSDARPGRPALCGVEVGERRMPPGRGCPGKRRRPLGSAPTLGNAGARGCSGCPRAVYGARTGPFGGTRRTPPGTGARAGAARSVRGGGGRTADAVWPGPPGERRRPLGSALTLGNAGARGCWGCPRAVYGARGCCRQGVEGHAPGPGAAPGPPKQDARTGPFGGSRRMPPWPRREGRGGLCSVGKANGGCRLVGADCRSLRAACLDGRCPPPGRGEAEGCGPMERPGTRPGTRTRP
jgi:hypothetical protein